MLFCLYRYDRDVERSQWTKLFKFLSQLQLVIKFYEHTRHSKSVSFLVQYETVIVLKNTFKPFSRLTINFWLLHFKRWDIFYKSSYLLLNDKSIDYRLNRNRQVYILLLCKKMSFLTHFPDWQLIPPAYIPIILGHFL